MIAKCNICGWENLGEFRETVKCRKCNVVSLYPLPAQNDLEKLYEREYQNLESQTEYHTVSGPTEKFIKLNNVENNRRIEILNKYCGDYKVIMDLGCGYGFLLNELKNLGKTVYGIEPNPFFVRYAKEKFFLNVEKNLFEKIYKSISNDYFDLIILSHILNIVIDPSFILDHCLQKLRTGGFVYVELPQNFRRYDVMLSKNFDIFKRKRIKTKFKLPRIYYYTLRQAEALLKKRGFKIIFSETYNPEEYGFRKYLIERINCSTNNKFCIPSQIFLLIDSIIKKLDMGAIICIVGKNRLK